MRFASIIGTSLCALALVACDRAESGSATTVEIADKAADPHAALPSYDVDRVAELIANKQVIPVDANSEETRKELGTLPGAVLLSDPKGFDLKELPSDKSANLVFYCGSERCRSAPKAAQRAQADGYKNVNVMPAGIRGWVKAGKSVDKTS